jgi:hypothetical protein
MTTTAHPVLAAPAIARDRGRELLGQVMGLVAVTVGFTALGAYLGRDLAGGTGLLLFIAAFAVIIGLNAASARGAEQVAIGLLFALGLLLGLAVAPVIAAYADGDPAALWQAAGATALVVAGGGSYGYATRRDLSSWARGLFWALLALLVFGIVALFVSIPDGNIVYAVAAWQSSARTRSSTSTACVAARMAPCPSRPRSSSTSSTCSCSRWTCSAAARAMSADSLHALDSRTEWLNSEPLAAAGLYWPFVPASRSRCCGTPSSRSPASRRSTPSR